MGSVVIWLKITSFAVRRDCISVKCLKLCFNFHSRYSDEEGYVGHRGSVKITVSNITDNNE